MKIPELTTEYIADYLRIDTPNDVQTREIEMAFAAAVRTVKDDTGRPDEFVNESDSFTLAVLVLTAEFYENRQYQAAGNKSSEVNKAVESILALDSINFI
jgi:hypothetical protein